MPALHEADTCAECPEASSGEGEHPDLCVDCAAVAWTCVDCDDRHIGRGEQNDVGYGWQNQYVCDSCRLNYSTCAGCENTYSGDDMYECEGGLYCDDCHSDLYHDECGEHHTYGNCSVGHPYDYEPSFRFYGNAPDGLFMGIELEMETNHENRAVFAPFRSLFDERFYGKHDGSLDAGIEIVSMPHSFAEWVRMAPALISALDGARAAGAYAWESGTAGMHIHVSTNTFTEAHLLRFARLVYLNRAHVTAFAGRDTERWAAFDPNTTAIVDEVKRHKNGSCSNNERYKAVNLSNERTVEVRIFRGTVRGERVMANIEFVHAAVEYTRTQRVGAKPNWVLFVKWASKREHYKHFTDLANELLLGTFDESIDSNC